MRYAILLTIFALFALPTKADERLLPYIEWIVENSDLTYDGQTLPTVDVIPYPLLEVTVYGPDAVARAEYEGRELYQVNGAYLHDTNAILFPEGADPWAQEDVLVHELVHFLQYLQPDIPDCIQSLERPAYDLHWRWVEASGKESVYTEPNWLFVYMIQMACERNYWEHPR